MSIRKGSGAGNGGEGRIGQRLEQQDGAGMGRGRSVGKKEGRRSVQDTGDNGEEEGELGVL